MIRNYPITIGIGDIGPTDACLTMSDLYKYKEFLIESPSWCALNKAAAGLGLPVTFNYSHPYYPALRERLYGIDTSEDENMDREN
jgi:hypothetical protein